MMNGIGGDIMVILFNAKDQKYYGYNGSGRSSKAVTKAYLQQQLDALNLTYIPATGPLPVSVPGAVKGWFKNSFNIFHIFLFSLHVTRNVCPILRVRCDVHARFGSLNFKQVLAPAIRYAREGFPVTQVIAEEWLLQQNGGGNDNDDNHIMSPLYMLILI